MTTTRTPQLPHAFADAIERFIRVQEGRHLSPQTLRAYRADLSQLAPWLHEDNPYLTDPIDVTTGDLNEFLAHLAHRGLSGVSRARKLATIRELYRPLKNSGVIAQSPSTPSNLHDANGEVAPTSLPKSTTDFWRQPVPTHVTPAS